MKATPKKSAWQIILSATVLSIFTLGAGEFFQTVSCDFPHPLAVQFFTYVGDMFFALACVIFFGIFGLLAVKKIRE